MHLQSSLQCPHRSVCTTASVDLLGYTDAALVEIYMSWQNCQAGIHWYRFPICTTLTLIWGWAFILGCVYTPNMMVHTCNDDPNSQPSCNLHEAGNCKVLTSASYSYLLVATSISILVFIHPFCHASSSNAGHANLI